MTSTIENPGSFKLGIDLAELKLLGTLCRPLPVPCVPLIETHYCFAKEVTPETPLPPAVFELRWSGFQLAETTDAVLAIIKEDGKGNFGVSGGGYIVMANHILQGNLEGRLEMDSVTQVANFIRKIFSDVYQFPSMLVVHWDQEALNSRGNGCIAIPFYVSTPCTEEEYRNYIQLHTMEVQAAKLVSVAVGIGFETSEGKTLQ